MQQTQLRNAKATLPAVIVQAVQGEPSVITRHGRPKAVVLSFAGWERLSRVTWFGQLLTEAPLEVEGLPASSGGLRTTDF